MTESNTQKVHALNKAFVVQAIIGYEPKLMQLTKNKTGQGYTAIVNGNGVYRRLFICPKDGQEFSPIAAHGQKVQIINGWLFEQKAEKKNDKGYTDTYVSLFCRNIREVHDETATSTI